MLELKNYKEHPTDFHQIIFYFFTPEQKEHFKTLALKEKLKFTEGEEPYQSKRYQTEIIYYFILKKTDFDKANHLSLLTYAKFRKPFIQDKLLRYFVLGLFLLMLTLAIAGAFLSN